MLTIYTIKENKYNTNKLYNTNTQQNHPKNKKMKYFESKTAHNKKLQHQRLQ